MEGNASQCRRVGNLSSKLAKFAVEFDTDGTAQPGLYLSGSTLTGHIQLEVLKPVSIVRISVMCHGSVKIGDKKEELIKFKSLLFGQEKLRKSPVKFPVGSYQYPFTVELEADLPTTTLGSEDLKISYVCVANLIRKSREDDIRVFRPFMVHHSSPDVYQRVTSSQTPSEQSLDCRDMEALITLERTGYSLGDQLKVNITVNNPTSSSQKLKVGITIHRRIIGHGTREFGLIRLDKTKKKESIITDRWSSFTKVPKKSSETFDLGIPLNLNAPTTNHSFLEIEYTAVVSIIAQTTFSETKPKSATFPLTVAPLNNTALYPDHYMEMQNLTGNLAMSVEDLTAESTTEELPPYSPQMSCQSDGLPSYHDLMTGKV